MENKKKTSEKKTNEKKTSKKKISKSAQKALDDLKNNKNNKCNTKK